MSVPKTRKAELFKTYGQHDQDTGSSSVQVALLTERIKQLTGHFENHAKDFSARCGLLKLVGKRRSLLRYLKNYQKDAYLKLLHELDLKQIN